MPAARRSSYTPVDNDGNTLGAVVPVAGTPLDFTAPAAIGARLGDAPHPTSWPPGYDSNLALFGLTNMTARSDVRNCSAHPTCAPALYLFVILHMHFEGLTCAARHELAAGITCHLRAHSAEALAQRPVLSLACGCTTNANPQHVCCSASKHHNAMHVLHTLTLFL
jgi:hypothetical protein